MNMRNFGAFAAGLLVVGSAGCVVGPDYERPSVTVPDQWSNELEQGVSTGESDLAEWWKTFDDPMLDALVQQAIEANLDLRAAESRIREARAAETFSEADLWPALNASAGYRRIQNVKPEEPSRRFTIAGLSATATPLGLAPSATILPAGALGPSINISPDLTGGGNSRVTVSTPQARGTGGLQRHDDLYQAGFDAGWELDLFGGTRREIEAARAVTEAVEESRRDIQVSLTAEVARQYFSLRAAQAGLEIATKNIEIQQNTLDLVRARFDAGLVGELDVKNAEAQLASTEATVPTYAAAVQYAIHRLGVLLGGRPDALQDELSTVAALTTPPPDVPIGLPSDLLRRRPDVRQAERELAAATARIGVATADLFPKVSLTGLFSSQDDVLYGIKRNANMTWSIGPSIRWPVFDAGRIRANIGIQNERQEQALLAYEQAVLLSLEDVENALVAYAKEQNRMLSLAKAAEANRDAVAIAGDLYSQGLVNFLSVLEAERSLAATEAQHIQSRAAVLTHLVALFKALGGGWDVAELAATGETAS